MKKGFTMKKRFWAMVFSCLMVFSQLTVSSYAEYGDDDYLQGDCDLNGKIDLKDYLTFQKNYLCGLDFTPEQFRTSDLDRNKKLDIIDVIAMKWLYINSLIHDFYYTFSSPDGNYSIRLIVNRDQTGSSSVSVNWYDPDGDKEKTDHFTIRHGNPFESEEADTKASYELIWNDGLVIIRFADDDGWKEYEFEYPDRTRTFQTHTETIENSEAPEVVSVDVSALSYGDISEKVKIRESGNVFSRDTAGRIGTHVRIDTDDSIESFKAVIHYDEDELRWVPEQNLTVLQFDPDAPQIGAFTSAADVSLDMDNNSVEFTGKNHCDYLLIDSYRFYRTKDEKYAYTIDDITKYKSDWERKGDTGDIVRLADKKWAKESAEKGIFYVSNARELASAVYYINTVQSLPYYIKSGYTQNFDIELTDDIDLSGYDWKPIMSLTNRTVNGNGHSIKNMNTKGNVSTEISGFIEKVSDCIIKDISFEETF